MRYILIHGLGQNSSSWDKMISCMRDNFSADCPDVTGQTSPNGGFVI